MRNPGMPSKRHAYIDAIPLPPGIDAATARGFFLKALRESNRQFACDSVRVRETGKGTNRGLRQSVPPNFSYVYVDFGLDCGYLMVEEDEDIEQSRNLQKSPFESTKWLKDIVAGLYGKTISSKKADSDRNKRWSRFRTAYDRFDWTKCLHENE